MTLPLHSITKKEEYFDLPPDTASEVINDIDRDADLVVDDYKDTVEQQPAGGSVEQPDSGKVID